MSMAVDLKISKSADIRKPPRFNTTTAVGIARNHRCWLPPLLVKKQGKGVINGHPSADGAGVE